MEYYLLIARSVTHAQQMARTLEQCGVHAGILRTPAGLTQSGCAYAVRIRKPQEERARNCLQQAQLLPKSVFAREDGCYREVVW